MGECAPLPSKQETGDSKESIKKEQPDACPVISYKNTPYSSNEVSQKRKTESYSECFQENGHIWNPCFAKQPRVHYITVPCIVSKDSSIQIGSDFTRIEHNQIYYTSQTYEDHREINIIK